MATSKKKSKAKPKKAKPKKAKPKKATTAKLRKLTNKEVEAAKGGRYRPRSSNPFTHAM